MGRVPLGASQSGVVAMSSPRRLRRATHLAKRFVGALSNAGPSADDDEWAQSCLLPGEQALWARMPGRDQRHSITVARRFAEIRTDATRAQVAGALLHDIGKIDSALGVIGRVAATLTGPRTDRFRRYHDHEAIGASLAADAGSDPLTVALIAGDESADGYAELMSADDL